MSHSYYKIWIHAVWATKRREPLIDESFENLLYDFLYEQFRKLDCKVCIINGMPDHIHCLFKMKSDKKLSEVIGKVKGSSSRFINKNKLVSDIFSWRTGYAAFSVSMSAINNVYYYIKNQKQHHKVDSKGISLNDS